MAMLYSFHENLEINDAETQFEVVSSQHKTQSGRKAELHLFTEKLDVPKFENQISRPRLNQMLLKSSRQFGATLILGRAGSGKTVLAAEFAKQYKKVAWYSIESADNSWEVFSKYFAKSFNEPLLDCKKLADYESKAEISEAEISHFVESLLLRLSIADEKEPRLIVLDNAHYVFDSEWFTDFFNTLVYSLSPNTHFLILSRCQPPLPLWRLRSKQALGVIDEKLLAFNFDETLSFTKKFGFSEEKIKSVYKKSFGRISKLIELSENS